MPKLTHFDDKGNPMTFAYDGLVGMMAVGGTTFGDNSSHYCVGAGSIPGKGFEMGHCIIKFINTYIDTVKKFYFMRTYCSTRVIISANYS